MTNPGEQTEPGPNYTEVLLEPARKQEMRQARAVRQLKSTRRPVDTGCCCPSDRDPPPVCLLLCSKAAVEDVQAQNLICILDVDIQGVRRIKETDLNPIYISIQPPSMETLVKVSPTGSSQQLSEALPSLTSRFPHQEKRLRDRQTETEESLQKRLEAARIDMELSEFQQHTHTHTLTNS